MNSFIRHRARLIKSCQVLLLTALVMLTMIVSTVSASHESGPSLDKNLENVHQGLNRDKDTHKELPAKGMERPCPIRPSPIKSLFKL